MEIERKPPSLKAQANSACLSSMSQVAVESPGFRIRMNACLLHHSSGYMLSVKLSIKLTDTRREIWVCVNIKNTHLWLYTQLGTWSWFYLFIFYLVTDQYSGTNDETADVSWLLTEHDVLFTLSTVCWSSLRITRERWQRTGHTVWMICYWNLPSSNKQGHNAKSSLSYLFNDIYIYWGNKNILWCIFMIHTNLITCISKNKSHVPTLFQYQPIVYNIYWLAANHSLNLIAGFFFLRLYNWGLL